MKSLSYLQYVDPREFWRLLNEAQSETQSGLDDPHLWQHVHDALMRAGVSGDYADEWRKGLRLLVSGSLPKGTP